jgi:hypothetical protein
MNVITTFVFPSPEWFRALADRARADAARFRRLGYSDMRLGLVVGDRGYVLEFRDFGDVDVGEWEGVGNHPDGRPTDAVDCVIRASLDDWRALVEHIVANGRADPNHTLNSLVLAGDRFVLDGDDQLGVDSFYRFNATIQALLDEAANIPTTFR